ncbi:protein TBATA [Tiliqua scincoides]|uniref:protein TBATA n=1 Tax=Tiliqua scincoides TaxID=71010 RepID=UPI003461F4BC
MEKPKDSITSTFKDKGVTTLAGKLKHLALNTPLQFSGQALRARPQSAARFGGLSHHSFSRHNPHPHRVTHIQSLNGIPVCIVNDEWSEQTILCPHPMIKSHLHTSVLGVLGVQMPIGDPQPFPVPTLSVGSSPDAWREELKELAARVRAASSTETEKKQTREKSQRETQYSEETRRLIPPSFQATTHHSSSRMNQNNGKKKGKAATLPFQDQELIGSSILELLSQILQTDSLTAIQQWLLAAGQREQNLVLELLQIATANLHLDPQNLTTSIKERVPSQSSPNATGIAFRQQTLERNPTRLLVTRQKQEPIPKEDKPAHVGTAEILKFHSSQNEKQNHLDQTN